MKTLLIGLLTLGSLSAFAGEIINERTGERISARCELSAESECKEYSILHHKDGSETLISTYLVRTIDNPKDQFLLREKIKKLDLFPVTHKVFGRDSVYLDYRSSNGPAFVNHSDGIIDHEVYGPMYMIGAGLVGGGTMTWLAMTVPGVASASAVGIATVVGVGGGLIVLPFLTPVAIDVASLPIRAMVKGLKVRRAAKNEILALTMLGNLINNQNELYELKNKKFKSLIETLKSINNMGSV
jgi:hypothetical protein